MKHLVWILAAIALASTALALTPPLDLPQCQYGDSAAKDSATAVGNLAVQLYQKISKLGDNVIFSPVSIALALALVGSGAAGGTRDEIQRLIGLPGTNQADSSDQYESLQRKLQIQETDARLSIANGIFYANSIHLKKPFMDKLKMCFQTQATEEAFASKPEESRQEINKWVSNATSGKIPELFKSGSIDAGTVAVLANAVYMKAAWQNKFVITDELPFYRSGKADQVQKVKFLVREGKYGYASTETFEIVELPYSEAPLSMFIILPKQRDGLPAVEQSLKGDQLLSLFDQIKRRQVNLKLPKYTIRQSVDLKDVLQQLGVQEMFSGVANFSRMAEEPLAVSKGVHEAYIKVNENGTEAAAATGFGMVVLSAMQPEPPIPFIADHPFMYAVVHTPTKAIVFFGRVNSVQQDEA